MKIDRLIAVAQQLVAPVKGILAADESGSTIQKRFDSIDVDSTEKNRRDYRELLFRTRGVSDFISGVILYDETLRQNAANGTPMVDLLRERGIVPGIKVDRGTHPLAGAPGELITEGLDGLRERLAEYYELGARFAKWRSVITIGVAIPSAHCIASNAHALARYATLCQEVGLVPIVEPEVLMDGDHDIERCFEVTEATLRETYTQLAAHRVVLEATLLKPNMVLSGKSAVNRAGPAEVAERSVLCYMRSVPAEVPGLVFLSGGQDDDEATENLNAINRQGSKVGAPWELSFSFGRGLQAAPLKTWSGDAENVNRAREVFHARARASSMARQGSYDPGSATAG